MNKIYLPKAEPITKNKPVEDMTIIISKKLLNYKKITTFEAHRKYMDEQAQKLVDALINSLPQGIIEPIMVKLMEHRISQYHGTMK